MKWFISVCIATVIGALLLSGSYGSAQEKMELTLPLVIQAQAMGQSTQLGRSFSVTVRVEEYSTPDDQKALITAFSEKKNEGLVNALSKMNSKGRLAITGTLGYDVNYIREFPMPDGGTKLRMVTDRPLRFGEVWSDTRSTDYNLSGLEIILSPDRKINSGTLLPACRFKINKEKQLELELLQNPWKLVNVMVR